MQLELHYGPTVTPDGVSLGLWSRWTSSDGYFVCMSSSIDGLSLAAGNLRGNGMSLFDLIAAAVQSAPRMARYLEAMSLGLCFPDQPGVH